LIAELRLKTNCKRRKTFATSEFGGLKDTPGTSGLRELGLGTEPPWSALRMARLRLQEIDRELGAARARLDALLKQFSPNETAVQERSRDQLSAFESSAQ